jgi:hypothetical protein
LTNSEVASNTEILKEHKHRHPTNQVEGEERPMLGTILLIILVLLIIGSIPAWPYARGWGYYPSGGLGLILVIVIVLLLMGYI